MSNLFNDNILKGKWAELKGQVQKTWGKLTDDELDQTKGDMTSLGGLIQEKYGMAQEEVRKKIHDLFAAFQKDTPEDGLNADEVAESRREVQADENLKDQFRQV